MEKFSKQNGRNIRLIFEEKTGVDLNPKHHMHSVGGGRKLAVLAMVLTILAATLVSCQNHIFSPLRGDELALSGSYEGNGVVAVTVTNESDMPLELEKKTKLMCWHTGEEVERLTGRISFEGNTEIAPHTSETLRIDLSEAYDIPKLEQEQQPQAYYLLLTNQNFLFGQDWMCSFRFAQENAEPVETFERIHAPYPVESEIMANIEEGLRFYFEDSYNDEVPAFNEQNFAYQDKVRELLMRRDGRFVRPVDPWLKVDKLPDGVIFDETVPEELQYILVGENYHSIDGCNRIVGSSFGGGDSDYSLMLQALLPQYPGQTDGGVYLPLIYMFTYPKYDIQSMEDFAFIYGQIITFGELEGYKVYENEKYVVYEVTDLFYRDLDGYIDYFLTTRPDEIYFDEAVRQRVHNIYDYYRNHENLSAQFVYHEIEGGAHPVVPPATE